MKEVLAHRFFWEHPRPGPKRSSPLSGTPRVFLARVHRYPRRGWMSPQRRFRCELGKRGAYRLSRQLSESKKYRQLRKIILKYQRLCSFFGNNVNRLPRKFFFSSRHSLR